MNRALKARTNLRDAKKKYDDKLPQISNVPAMNSFCLYLKMSVLSFMNKAVKIQPSISWGGYWGRLPPGGGGHSHTLPIRVCAAQRGRDFEAPDLERDIHFRGVF